MTHITENEDIYRVLHFNTGMVFFEDTKDYYDNVIQCRDTFLKNNRKISLDGGICIRTGYTRRLLGQKIKSANIYNDKVLNPSGKDAINNIKADKLLHHFFPDPDGCVYFYGSAKLGDIMKKVNLLRKHDYCFIGEEIDLSVFIDSEKGDKIAYVSLCTESG